MSTLVTETFEPVYLELSETKITDHGKKWLELRYDEHERFNATLKDVTRLAYSEHWKWPTLKAVLDSEGIPQAISSGISQYAMPKLIDHLNNKATFAALTTVAMALATAAPTSTTTGATLAEANYTGYGRQTLAGTAFNSASAATPSVATNNGAITFGNCTAGTNTLLGFATLDGNTTGAGNVLWYGTLTSVTISVTQTPPTVGSGVMNLSMTGV